MSILVKKCSSQEKFQDYLKAKEHDINFKSKGIKSKIKIQDYKHAKGTSKEFLRPNGSKTQDVIRTTKDETICILKKFITDIENLVDKKVKENGIAERRNTTLIEAARTMLADSKLPTTFWTGAVNTACYGQNRVLVVKPHNKTPYELFRCRTPALSFMRPFGCHVTILNTLDHLGKFNGKADEGFFVGYLMISKDFKVYKIRTRRAKENLHIEFLENKPIVAGNGPEWLFDIDMLTKSMNCVLVVVASNELNFAFENLNTAYPDDPKMPGLETIKTYDDSEEDADFTNLESSIHVSPTPTTRIQKNHPLKQVIGTLSDLAWVEAMQEEILQFKLQKVWILLDLPKGKKAIGTKWVFRNKKDERGIVIMNKARLVAHGYT
nr:retrovirus-related Pol polyprotein from transposon TNT 1-94 [Tanacetum cinerariifolium]